MINHLQPTAEYENLNSVYKPIHPTYKICIALLSGSLQETGHNNTEFHKVFNTEGTCRCNIEASFDLKPAITRHTLIRSIRTLSNIDKNRLRKAIIQRKNWQPDSLLS